MYDIYLLPPGEDPETCQSWLRMRNKDGRYDLRFEEWVVDGPFVISPRISFEVCSHSSTPRNFVLCAVWYSNSFACHGIVGEFLDIPLLEITNSQMWAHDVFHAWYRVLEIAMVFMQNLRSGSNFCCMFHTVLWILKEQLGKGETRAGRSSFFEFIWNVFGNCLWI